MKMSELLDEKENFEVSRNRDLIKAPRWGYAFFKSSIYFHYNLTFYVDLLIGVALTFFFGLITSEQRSMPMTSGKTNIFYCKYRRN